MATPRFGWVICGGLAAIAAAVLALRWQAAGVLRTEIRLKRDEVAELGSLRKAHEDLKRDAGPAGELENLRADREAVKRMRAEIEALKANVGKTALPPAPPTPKNTDTFAAKSWTNAGRATPRASLQTALWAGLNGDVDLLAETIVFETPAAREQAQRLLAEAPPDLRVEYSTPEKMVALLSARDMPTDGIMRVVGEKVWNENETTLAVVFFPEKPPPPGAAPAVKNAQLKLRREADDWKLTVPAAAVDRYGAMLKGGTPANAR